MLDVLDKRFEQVKDDDSECLKVIDQIIELSKIHTELVVAYNNMKRLT